ncbi:hypothetical protein QOZ80_5AG0399230 [Eleusine coracana subsp. coracana]|nr:hypothetical protein QOZ80_5AG0399110 [Eleusine coracana subsp. coracana]KAK3140314.1 hypothetical protein QOZ80_5AG0399230 [Eleusine coracana subsp. coracana]
MEDATGRSIWGSDTAVLNSSPERVLVARRGGTPAMVDVQRIDGSFVKSKAGGLTVVDRSYLRPGMVVASESDPGGPLGVVTAAATALDLVHRNGDGAAGVSPADLRRVVEISVGDYVVSSSSGWLGRVVEAGLDADVVFDDGGRCRVAEASRKLRAVVKEEDYVGRRYTNTRLFPGQRVSSSASSWRTARWLHGSYWKPSYVQGTVAMVKRSGVLVYWLASLPHQEEPPAFHQNVNDLIFFCSPNVNSWRVGDRCFFRNNNPPSSSSSCDKHKDDCVMRKQHQRKKAMMMRKKRTREITRLLEVDRPMLVADTHTTVDVLWQDGTRQRGVPSATLSPYVPKNHHDFFPGQHVRKTVADDDAQQSESPPPVAGVVRSLDCKDQTVRVSWLITGDNNNMDDNDETVSAYHLGRILDHDVFYGNIVIRLHAAAAGTTSSSTDKGDLSWVGRVVDLCDDGQVQVKWGDGTMTKVLPHEVAVVKEQWVTEMLRQMGDWVYDDGSDNTQDDTTNQAQPTANTVVGNQTEGNNDQGQNNNTDDAPAATSIISRVSSAIIRLGSIVLEQGKRSFRVTGWTTVEPLAAASENIEPVSISTVANALEIDTSVAETVHGEGEGKAEADDATAGVEAFRFQQFDVVQSPPDHRYLDNVGQGTIGGKTWTKGVQREWKILENDLPDTIYVRAFEDRMDLLRAVMVGACGTPYQDGLFFFDLQLPPSYPAAPPLVNYHSFGLRLNPNLYPSGTVCLSLLGTFGGQDIELWSPESSTVLQVLVSIQGLVLTALPYYNEAGYASQVGTPMGHRNELPYSENTYLLSLQTMLHLLRRPPAGFEDFVRDHFRRRGRHVLRACEAYREGCLIGTLDGEANATEASKARPCSTGFRLALDNIVPRLMAAFAEIGADVCQPAI